MGRRVEGTAVFVFMQIRIHRVSSMQHLQYITVCVTVCVWPGVHTFTRRSVCYCVFDCTLLLT